MKNRQEKTNWTDEFGGMWNDDPRSAEEIIDEIKTSRHFIHDIDYESRQPYFENEAMILMVQSTEYVGNYTLVCTFNNGVKKRVDLSPLLKYPAYEELKDEKEFIRYGVDGTVFWANGADIAPEYLFEHGIPC